MTYSNWFVDYADPYGYINHQFASDGFRPGLSRIPAWSGEWPTPRGWAATPAGAYSKLDRDLAADAAPAAAFATGTTSYFLSARMGRQVLHPVFGLDLAALCVRRR